MPGAAAAATAATRGASRVRVATYNVLSQTLCRPNHFTACAPEALDPEARLERVKEKLEAEVAQGSVLCLQEVSMSWAGELHTFFDKRGYRFVETLYSGPFSDYMGVGLAVPRARFELEEVRIKRVADVKRWPAELNEAVKAEGLGRGGGLGAMLRRLGKGALRLPLAAWGSMVGKGGEGGKGPPAWMAGEKKQKPRSKHQHWLDSRRRQNRAIGMRLRDTSSNERLCVATYHMPCMFWDLSAMVIHSALVAQWAQKLAGETPLCLAGDFNIKPGDPAYELLANGDLPADAEGFPPAEEWEPWRPKLRKSFASAYVQALGAEPDFTNHAQVRLSHRYGGRSGVLGFYAGAAAGARLRNPDTQTINLFLYRYLKISH